MNVLINSLVKGMEQYFFFSVHWITSTEHRGQHD